MGVEKPEFFSRKFAVLVLIAVPLFLFNNIQDSQAALGWSVRQDDVRRHIVRPGETLAIIAQNYGFELKELAEYNKLTNPNKLLAGQTIYLPNPEAAKQQVYTRPSAPASRIQPRSSTPDPVMTNPQTNSQLQQMSGGRVEFQGGGNVDYNYTTESRSATGKRSSDLAVKGNTRATGDMGTQSKANKDLMRESAEEELIADTDSPALAVFGDRPYAYYANGEALADTLQNFAASYYLPARIEEGVTGTVNGKIGPLQPVDFLDHMANIYGFLWYFDGHSLYIYRGNSAQQRIISLEYMTTEGFKKTLKKVGIWDGRFFWKEQPKEGLVYVSGPPRYIEMVAQTADLLDKKEGDRQKSKLTVRMFKLKYAWATDKSFNFRGKEIVVPGVATLLRSIVSGGGVSSVQQKAAEPAKLEPVKGLVRNGVQKNADSGKKPALNSGIDAEGTYISADPRLNAIIVHDLESKMPMYEGLIASLDKPSSQVEVSVSIIDVNTDDVEALGVDWNNTRASGNSEVRFGTDNSAFAQDLSAFTTVLELSRGSFNARLNLLEDEGRAKVVSKPSILTLDNLEAVFDNSSTFYVSVASQEDAELFPVTSGTVVQVTPRIVDEDAGRKIHMSVNIQDGGDSNDANLSLPRVSNSSISTQAVVNENESLLIGGFYKETQNQKTTKVPLLGDIPLFGRLFKAEKKQNISQVRLFLITPRILSKGI